MAVDPISQANGADLLTLNCEGTGQSAPALVTATMSAIGKAQLSIEELLNAKSPRRSSAQT